MQAYYASTNIQLINLLNLKVNVFPSSESDLYISNNGKIFPELISLIQDAAAFRKIHLININDHIKPVGNQSLFHKVSSAFIARKYYYRQICLYSNEITYSHLIFNGFWMNATYILLILYSRNPNLRVSFIDEGMRSYNLSKKALCSNYGSNIMGNIWYYFVIYSRFRKISTYQRCVEDIYLYQPELYCDKKNMEAKQLPKMNSHNQICLNILKKLSYCMDSTEYQTRNIYYFVQDQYNKPSQKMILTTYLDILTQTFDPLQVIIKEHPNSIAGYCSHSECQNTDLFVDTRLYLFEAMLLNIDINAKVFIARDSSSLIYPKFMFDAEPYVIFTYKLYPEYYINNIIEMDRLSNGLISSYVNKEKVLIPSDISEFKYMLETIIKPSLSNVENV